MAFSLDDTPGNTAPPGARVTAVHTRDGRTLRAATWAATARRPRGTVCLLQGRAEFIEKYHETVGELLARGFAVAAFDWRGQGASDRDVDNPHKGHVGDFAEFEHDLAAVREQVLEAGMPRPYFGLAHSMGAAIALMAAREGWLPFERLVALAPMLSIRMIKRPAAVRRLALVLDRLGFSRHFVPGGGETSIARKPFRNNRLTADPARYARNAAAAAAVGAGAIGEPTVGWLAAAFRFMRRLEDPAFPRAIRAPILIVAAGADPVCGTPEIERFAVGLRAGAVIVLPGSRHEILMERDPVREAFWAAFDAFVPGTRVERSVERSSGGGEPFQRGFVETSVARGDDRAA